MQFTKPMIELVFEIRRTTPSELKPSIKLANPELFSELQLYFHDSANAVGKALIKELFHLAGEPWPGRLETATAGVKQTVRVYRGQIQLQDSAENSSALKKKENQVSKRIYRGQVVDA